MSSSGHTPLLGPPARLSLSFITSKQIGFKRRKLYRIPYGLLSETAYAASLFLLLWSIWFWWPHRLTREIFRRRCSLQEKVPPNEDLLVSGGAVSRVLRLREDFTSYTVMGNLDVTVHRQEIKIHRKGRGKIYG